MRVSRLISKLGLAAAMVPALAVVGCGAPTGNDTTASRTIDKPASTETTTEPGSETTTTPAEPPTPPAPTTPETQPTSYPSNAAGEYLEPIPPDEPGGSAITMITPCDSGTATMTAYPEGEGVAMSVTLRDVGHQKWYAYPTVTPALFLTGTPRPRTYTANDGVVTIKTSNLRDPGDGINYAWPQRADIEYLVPTDASEVADCDGSVYLGSSVDAHTRELSVKFRRDSNTIGLSGLGDPLGGNSRVRVEVTSPNGVQRETMLVEARSVDAGGLVLYEFAADITGFDDLGDFTRIAITATDEAQRTSRLTLIRTP